MKSSYKLEIDTELWRAFKSKCATEGKSMIEVITEKIKEYVSPGKRTDLKRKMEILKAMVEKERTLNIEL